MIDVLVPVLDRPRRALPIAESVWKAATLPYRLTFLITPGDEAQRRACEDAARVVPGVSCEEVPFIRTPGDYARKINYGYAITAGRWLFTGADDLDFHHGWDRAAVRCGETQLASVVGTNDLGNPSVIHGKHSTHSLVRRAYVADVGATFDRRPGELFFEGYDHQYVDTELVAAALQHGLYTHCSASIVEHLHPLWRKSDSDSTYRLALAEGREDARRFRTRLRLQRA